MINIGDVFYDVDNDREIVVTNIDKWSKSACCDVLDYDCYEVVQKTYSQNFTFTELNHFDKR